MSFGVVGDLDLSLVGRGLRLRVLSREKVLGAGVGLADLGAGLADLGAGRSRGRADLGAGLTDLLLGAGAGLADLTLEALGLLPPSSATSKADIVGAVSVSVSSSEL